MDSKLEDIIHIIECDTKKIQNVYLDTKIEEVDKHQIKNKIRSIKIDSLIYDNNDDNIKKDIRMLNEDLNKIPQIGLNLITNNISLDDNISFKVNSYSHDELFDKFKNEVSESVIDNIIKCAKISNNKIPKLYLNIKNSNKNDILKIFNMAANIMMATNRIGKYDFILSHTCNKNILKFVKNEKIVYNSYIQKDLIILGRKGKLDEKKIKLFYKSEIKCDIFNVQYSIEETGDVNDFYISIKLI